MLFCYEIAWSNLTGSWRIERRSKLIRSDVFQGDVYQVVTALQGFVKLNQDIWLKSSDIFGFFLPIFKHGIPKNAIQHIPDVPEFKNAPFEQMENGKFAIQYAEIYAIDQITKMQHSKEDVNITNFLKFLYD